MTSAGWLASGQAPPRCTNSRYGKSSRWPLTQASTNRAATASGCLLCRGQSWWKNFASSGRRGLSFTNPQVDEESSGASRLHAVQRSHCGNGLTGTPTRDACPVRSPGVSASQGGGRSSLTGALSSLPTAASSLGSVSGSHSGTVS